MFPSSPWGEAFSGVSKTAHNETGLDGDEDDKTSLLMQAVQFILLLTNSAPQLFVICEMKLADT